MAVSATSEPGRDTPGDHVWFTQLEERRAVTRITILRGCPFPKNARKPFARCQLHKRPADAAGGRSDAVPQPPLAMAHRAISRAISSACS